MKYLDCQHCGETVPLNESLTVVGEGLCLPCAEKVAENIPSLSEDDVERNMDRTICVKCGTDRGDFENDLIMGFPVCPTCAPTFGNMPFPAWIKWSALGLAVLVVLSFTLNMRFHEANKELAAYWESMDTGAYHEATLLAEAAAAHVPEDWMLPVLAEYSAGLAYLMDDQPREALDRFEKCQEVMPPDFNVEFLIKRCYQSIAFDEEDYARFLSLAREDLKNNPQDSHCMLVVASGLACRYVETGDVHFKTKSEMMIAKALKQDSGDDNKEYATRIKHRLHSKEILQPKEYTARYPYGWTPEEEVP